MWKGNFKPFMFQPNLYLKRYICKFWIKCSDLCAGVNGSGTCMVRARPRLILKSIAAKNQTYGAIPWKTEKGKNKKSNLRSSVILRLVEEGVLILHYRNWDRLHTIKVIHWSGLQRQARLLAFCHFQSCSVGSMNISWACSVWRPKQQHWSESIFSVQICHSGSRGRRN